MLILNGQQIAQLVQGDGLSRSFRQTGAYQFGRTHIISLYDDLPDNRPEMAFIELDAGGVPGQIKVSQGDCVIQLSCCGTEAVLHRKIPAADSHRFVEPGSFVQGQDGLMLLLYRLPRRCV